MVLNFLKKAAGIYALIIILLSFAGWYIHGEAGIIFNSLGAIISSVLALVVSAIVWVVFVLLIRVVIWGANITTWLSDERAEFLVEKLEEYLPDFD